MNIKLLLLLPLGTTLLAPLLAGADVTISAEIRLGKVPPPPPPEVVVIEEPGVQGPPPWAPAHGFRRNHHYYYYPGAHVYYRPADRVWFYLAGGNWRFGISLPSSIRIDFDRCVPLTMETKEPHLFHDQVQAHYPPDYFVTKVRVKETGGKSGKSKPGDGDTPGKGKSKGKGRDK